MDLAPSASAPRVTAAGESAWWLRSFSPATGYVGAVAGDFPIAMLGSYEWTPVEADEPCLPTGERISISA